MKEASHLQNNGKKKPIEEEQHFCQECDLPLHSLEYIAVSAIESVIFQVNS
jgi:hypothetical protein